jgi:uncharacterized protein (DUF1015 family)
MAEIRPFRGLRFRDDLDLAQVLAPPYDVIPREQRAGLLRRHERNVVRLILAGGDGDAGYDAAGAEFRRWRDDGTLLEEREEALYVLEQSFELAGRRLQRFGLLARFRAEAPERGMVLPHEQTRTAAREDRWRMLLATRADFSPIFLMFLDAGGALEARMRAASGAPPLGQFTDDQQVGHRLWRLGDPETVAAFRDALAGAKSYIADGHHRYATALRYGDVYGAQGAFTFGYFTPVGSQGLVVLPYHRVLSAGPDPAAARRALEGAFRLSPASGVPEAAHKAAASRAPHAFALAWPTGEALVAEAQPAADDWLPAGEPPSLRALDTFFLHRGVLPRLGVGDDAVGYVHSLAEAQQAVGDGRCRLALLLRGTPVQQILDVAEARESMPAKSTFFHPKLPSGLVIHPLLT